MDGTLIFRPESKKQSRAIQKRLIDLGCRWNKKRRGDRLRGHMAIPHNTHHNYIFVKNYTIFTDNTSIQKENATIFGLYVGRFIIKHFGEETYDKLKNDEKIYTNKKRHRSRN